MSDDPKPRPRAARVQLALSLLVFAAATAGLHAGVAWISSWYYDLSWWSYILLVDAVVHLKRGRSLFLSRPRAFFLLAAWSAAFWLFFELVNFRLENWYYVGIPRDALTRSAGVFLSFATVLPGVLGTYELCAAFGLARARRTRPFAPEARALRAATALGLAFLVLPIAFPRIFYPLIWGATVLLAEPWLARRGARGLLTTLAAGDPRPSLRLLAAGVVCGLLWESLNAEAHAKWIYTVPLLEEAKLFEMPFAGFLGFPPFALECFTFARVLVALGLVPEWELDRARAAPVAAPPATTRRELAGLASALLFAAPLVVGVNLWTLRATLPMVDEIVTLPAAHAARLRDAGIATSRELLAADADGRLAALSPGVSRDERARWIEAARLMHTAGLGARGARWLAAAGVDSVESLARADAEDLLAGFAGRGDAIDLPPPRAAEVRVWIRAARRALTEDRGARG